MSSRLEVAFEDNDSDFARNTSAACVATMWHWRSDQMTSDSTIHLQNRCSTATTNLFLQERYTISLIFRATSHTSQELWPRDCESPKEELCGHGPSSVVWSYMWLGPQLNAILNEILFMQVFTHDKLEWTNGCECYECCGLLVCVRFTSKRWFWEIIQVIMKYDLFDAV